VGYKLSPFLWKKIARGLSAGRVQSVALKTVVEREKEIQDFIAQEYWSIIALLEKDKDHQGTKVPFDTSPTARVFESSLVKKDGKPIDKLEIKNEKEAKQIIEDLEGAEYEVEKVDKKEVKRNAPPPFTTSTMQQQASKKLGFPARFTMGTAQKLYEKGFITYHRTDSLSLSDQSLFAAKDFIIKEYGEKYWAGFFKKYKTKSKGAQEAHEAIRPSYPNKTPESLKLGDEDKSSSSAVAMARLYELIWKRFMASQMAQAVFSTQTADIKTRNYGFRTTGQLLKFDGFLKVYPIKFEEKELPELKEGDKLKLKELNPDQHFTQPPPRYNEASLIKFLEENGIGRPSTYASILSNLQDKNYIEKNDQRRFQSTEIGTVVNNMLVEHFPKIVDIGFTSEMESELDKIASGEKKILPVMEDFYDPFMDNLEEKYKLIDKKDVTDTPTDKICPECNSPLIIKLGRYGKFYACSGFPKCKYTESLKENDLGIKCPKCKKGKLVLKRTKKRKIFYGCNTYPKCDYALWYKPTGKFCPKCKSMLVEMKKDQIKCSNVECRRNEAKDEASASSHE